MKPEQQAAIYSSVIGAAMGVASNYLGSLTLSVFAPIFIYAGFVMYVPRMFEGKKPKWAVINTLGSFVLTWLFVWVLLYNLVL